MSTDIEARKAQAERDGQADASLAVLTLAAQGIHRDHPDWQALLVAEISKRVARRIESGDPVYTGVPREELS